MVIERGLGLFSSGAVMDGWSASETRPKMSKAIWVAISLSLAAHVAGGLYLYLQRTTYLPVVLADGPITTIATIRSVDLKTPASQPLAKVVRVHPPTTTAPTEIKALDVPPQPKTAPVTDTGKPPILAQTVLGPDTPHVAAQQLGVIRNPNWLSQPSAEQMSQYYPERALALDRAGSATLNCTVTAQGGLTSCNVANETPAGWGFGEAARKLAHYFRMTPKTEDGVAVADGRVSVTIHFNIAS